MTLKMPNGRSSFVVVANRLPVDRTEMPDGSTAWRRSPGGLVTALAPVMQGHHGAWIGWTGSPAGYRRAKVLGHGRADKIRIVKFRRRKHHRKQMGHRQHYTEIEITGIAGGDKK